MHARCKCGRYATIGEWKAGIGTLGYYECPDCSHHRIMKFIKENKSINK
jgi:DNA-directed RNA polymerase subunit RPC12/RpoP